MSSPLNSLNKTKKSPFSQKNVRKSSVPFRPAEQVEEQYLLDEITSRIAVEQNQRKLTASIGGESSSKFKSVSSKSSLNPGGQIQKSANSMIKAPSEVELLSTMMQRISQLEGQVSFYSKEILDKDKNIKLLEEKLELASLSEKRLPKSSDPSYVDKLEGRCADLQEQIFDMESFLSDYGMIWVGDKSIHSTDEESLNGPLDNKILSVRNGTWKPAAHVFHTGEKFNVDYEMIIKNINDLNIIAGEGISAIEKTKGGARLKMQETISMVLYSNGIMLFDGPFRSFEETSTQRCLVDIMDGYFPSELQNRYPDGVPIKVTDRRNVEFRDPRQVGTFPGVGRSLHESRVHSIHPASNIGDGESVSSDLPGERLSISQFLEKLPKTVIRDSKVIDVRSSISDVFGKDSSKFKTGGGTKVVATAQLKEMQKRMELPEKERPQSARDIATIRVKCENGSKTLLLKMKFADTIGDLRKYIDKQRRRPKQPYEILSTFPKRVHSDFKKTLQESGLTPNATLHLKPCK